MDYEPSEWQREQAAKYRLPLERFRFAEARGNVTWALPQFALKRTGHYLGTLAGDQIELGLSVTSTAKGAPAPYRVRVTFRGRTITSTGSKGGLSRGIQVAREIIREIKLGIR